MLALSSPEDSSPYYLTFMVFLSLLELDSDWKSNSFVMELFWEAMFGNVKISFVFVFWWHDHFWLNYSFKRSCKKIWKAAFKNFGVFFFVQPRASCSLLLKRTASVFEAFEEINPKFQCCKICICDHMKTAQIQMQLESWQRYSTDQLSNCG